MTITGNIYSAHLYTRSSGNCLACFISYSHSNFRKYKTVISTLLMKKWKDPEFIQLGGFKFGHGRLGISCAHFPYATEIPCNKIKQALYISQACSLEHIPTRVIPQTRTIKMPKREHQLWEQGGKYLNKCSLYSPGLWSSPALLNQL